MRLLLPLLLAAALPAVDGYQAGDGTAGLGALTGPVPLAVQAQTGLAPGEGTMVRRVIPWAPAGSIGLQEGDVIVAIDGVPVDSRRELRQEIWSNRPGDPFELQVLRGSNQPITLRGSYGRIPDWLEPRLRLPDEDWEQHVAARQRAYLAAVEASLAAAEAAAQAVRDQAQALRSRGLPPLEQAPQPPRSVLGLRASAEPWTFHYRWRHEAGAARGVEL